MEHLNPINYRIHIEPNLKQFTFSGSTELLVEAMSPVKEIILNALGLAFWNCNVGGDEKFVECPFQVDPQKEELTIFLPNEMVGKITLRIAHMGEINNRLAGFYRSKYLSQGKAKDLAVTQFEESDARRAFPCFDHPGKKATFEVEMVIDEQLGAISNCPIKEERPLGDGRKLITFKPTPKMSPYLLFFGVGEFEFIEEARNVLVRIATMPGMTRYAHFGLEFATKSLRFCEEYYGIAYPLPKLDLIAVPDFAAGAMENWGAITFRENLLLHYPNITSREGEERICEVIAHEMAHQWFGNLVTPSDWKYLWLNESFATYFAYKTVDYYHPEWEVWEQFLHSQTDPALRRDALLETFPIEIPGGAHMVINVSTAPIIYNKGGSILRQVEGYMGNAAFKTGLRHYLKKHEYGAASSHNLWEALEGVSERPITALMKSWVEEPGFPLVEVKREGERLSFTQKRFSYLPNESDQEWLIPITTKVFYQNGNDREITVLLENKSASFPIGSNAVAYKVNYGQAGFYRVVYKEKPILRELGNRVAGKELPSVDRWGLQNDFYALLGKGAISVDDYLSFLSCYAEEDAYLPLIGIAGNLFHAYLITEGITREKIASFGKPFLEKVLATIGYAPHAEEGHLPSILRDQVLLHAVLYGSREAAAFARDAFSSLMKGGPVPPDIMKSIMQVGALDGNEDTFRWFDQRLRLTESEHERMNILAALGSFREPSLIKKVRHYILENVPDRNKFIPISYLAANPYALPSLWDWYESNVGQLEAFHPVHYERVVAAIVPVCGLGKEGHVKAFFKDYLAKKEKAKDVIKLSLERLEINSRMKCS